MYRVHFDERTGLFVLQILRFGFIWITVKGNLINDITQPVLYPTYESVIKHVKEIGLDKLYSDGSRNRFLEAVRGPL